MGCAGKGWRKLQELQADFPNNIGIAGIAALRERDGEKPEDRRAKTRSS